jgi:hypothetical protein
MRTRGDFLGCVLALAAHACSKDSGIPMDQGPGGNHGGASGTSITGVGSDAPSGSGGGGGSSGARAPSTGATTNGSTDADADSGGGAEGVTAVDADIAAIVANISSSRLSQRIQSLVAFGTRSSCSTPTTGSQGIVPARDWIKAQLDSIGGLTTSLFPFTQTGCTESLVRDNVVAVLPGSTHPERIVVVGGHYDSRTITLTDGTSPAPGANDSGSQTAVVLELARVFAGHNFDATLVLVAFAGEEEGLVGSAALAQNIGSVVPNGQVVAMLNCDIVGGNSDTNGPVQLQQFRLYSPGTPREVGATTPDGTPDDTSPSRGLMRYVATWGSAYVPQMTILPELREDRPGRGGDHESFIARGWPGVRFIETVESPDAGTLASHEHSPNDLFVYVTPTYTANIAQVVASVAASLARSPGAPGTLAVSGNAGQPMLTWSVPTTGAIDHYVIAARPVTENFYHARVRVNGSATCAAVTPAGLGVDATNPYFISVGAVDARGHESLFAYPEYRCDTGQCVVPSAALNITATD